jgi:ParB family chromosome partitioning protein
VTQKKVLGRGLGALIPSNKETAIPKSSVNEIPVEQIAPNPYQPRRTFGSEAIDELTRSVAEHGVIQPLIVRRVSADRYQLIAGERRFRAAQKAGLKAVPVVVKDNVSNEASLEIALIENVQREDLNPIEEAIAYQQLHQEFGLTQDEIAKKVGKERSTVANFLRLLKLPDEVKTLLAGGQLSMGHARALLSVDDRKKQQAIALRVVKQGLNVRQTELLTSSAPRPVKTKETIKDVFTRDAEEKLTRTLRTKVEIGRRRRGGTIVLHFTNEDELIRLYEDLSGHGRHR